MSEFSTYLYNPNFIKANAPFNNGREKFAYVEDPSDIRFWSQIICEDEYKIYPFSRAPGSRGDGKRELEKIYQHASKNTLICVDSDYDYLCPETNREYANQLVNNPYILHTIAYGRESVIYSEDNLENISKKFRFIEPLNFPIKDFLEEHSKNCYRYIVLKLYFDLPNNSNHLNCVKNKIKDLESCLKFSKKNDNLFKENLTLNFDLFKTKNNEAKNIIRHLCKYIDKNKIKYHIKTINDKEINKHNACFFINSHIFEENIIKKMIKEILSIHKTKELNNLKNNKQRENQIHKHYKNKCNIDTIIESSWSYLSQDKNNAFLRKIKEKYESIVELN